jgi:hypothetical protein
MGWDRRGTYLGQVIAVVDGTLQTPAQRALRVAAAEQLPDLGGELPRLGLGRLGQRRVEGRGVEVDARVRVEGVDVDPAPGVRQRGRRVLLYDGHGV